MCLTQRRLKHKAGAGCGVRANKRPGLFAEIDFRSEAFRKTHPPGVAEKRAGVCASTLPIYHTAILSIPELSEIKSLWVHYILLGLVV
jgi:hypothetical protein